MSDASEKAYALEARLAVQVVEGWTIAFEAIKGGDTGRTSTTLADDPDLTFADVPAGTYMADWDLLYDGGSGANEGDFKFHITAPGGATANLSGIVRLASDAGNLHQGIVATGGSSIIAYTNGVGTTYGISMHGNIVIATPGTVALRWACGTNTGTSSHALANSRMALYRRI